jgi:3alpha(or 20beta)-hydroxysteroid dehydrogenase
VSEGARVVIGDILDDDGLAVAETLGRSAHFTHLDVADPDQWDAAVEAAVPGTLR